MRKESEKTCRKIAAATVSMAAAAIIALTGGKEAFADTTAKLAVSSAEGKEGDTVSVTVSLEENPGVAGAVFKVGYDTNVLQLVSAKQPENALLQKPTINTEGNAFVGYSYADVADTEGNGSLLTVEFTVKNGAPIKDSEVTVYGLDFSNAAEESIEVTPVNGKVTVLCGHGDKRTDTIDATCTEEGQTVVTCNICNTVLETTKIPAKGHIWGEVTTIQEPDCVRQGKGTKVCGVCQTAEDVTLEATGHTWVSEITKKATEEEDGVITIVCIKGDSAETKAIPALKGTSDKLTQTVTLNAGKYTAGDTVVFAVSVFYNGNSEAPALGDVRYIPVSWRLNDGEDILFATRAADYTADIVLENAGSYTLAVTYKTEFYAEDGWRDAEQTVTSITVLQAEEAPTQQKPEDNTTSGSDSKDETSSGVDSKDEISSGNDSKDDTSAATEKKNNGKTDDNVKTGDAAGRTIAILLFLCMASGGAAFALKKRSVR